MLVGKASLSGLEITVTVETGSDSLPCLHTLFGPLAMGRGEECAGCVMI